MKNSTLVTILVLCLLFRGTFSLIDIFIVFLVARLLTAPEKITETMSSALLVSLVASFLVESPIGVFPLVLSITLLLFSTLARATSSKGVAPLLTWTVFAFTTIILERSLRLALTTSTVLITRESLVLAGITVLAILLFAFSYSFKRKI